jgi:hypothetical protein
MAALCSIGEYLQIYGSVLGERVLAQFPSLHSPADPWALAKSDPVALG